MANEKKQEINQLSSPKVQPSILSYEEYYEVLMFAKKIRLEHKEVLQKAKTAKEKTSILEQLFIQYNVLSTSSKEKEKATLLKINIFIPDNEQFIEDYKEKYGKNVRLIADAYQVPAPFVFQKVTEIGKYEQYLSQIKKNGGLEEPILETNSSFKNTPESTVSESVKSNSSSSSKKGKTPKKKGPNASTISNTDKKSSANNPVIEQTPSSTGIINEELLHHIDSMQRYCTRLLDQNEQLSSKNNSLISVNKNLEEIIKRFQKENKDLVAQIEQLKKENTALSSSHPPRTIAEETATERDLRQENAQLKYAIQELTDKLASEEKKKTEYRKRAAAAEAQLDHLQHGMRGIFQEVDALDLSFNENTRKQL